MHTFIYYIGICRYMQKTKHSTLSMYHELIYTYNLYTYFNLISYAYSYSNYNLVFSYLGTLKNLFLCRLFVITVEYLIILYFILHIHITHVYDFKYERKIYKLTKQVAASG